MADSTDPIDPSRYVIHPDGRIKDAQNPDQSQWQRKHRPEAESAPAKKEPVSTDGSGWKILGTLGSIVLTVVGVCAGLSNRNQDGDTPPPPAVNFQGASNLQELINRHRLPTVAMDELEAKLAPVEKAIARIQAIPNWTTKDFEKPETAEVFAKLRRILGDLRSSLDHLEQARLSPEDLIRLAQLSQRVDELHCIVVALTGRDD